MPRWLPYAVVYVFQTAAVYLLYQEGTSGVPLSRTSAVLMALYVGAIVLCILANLLIGVYNQIQHAFDYAHFSDGILRDDLQRQIKGLRDNIQNRPGR